MARRRKPQQGRCDCGAPIVLASDPYGHTIRLEVGRRCYRIVSVENGLRAEVLPHDNEASHTIFAMAHECKR